MNICFRRKLCGIASWQRCMENIDKQPLNVNCIRCCVDFIECYLVKCGHTTGQITDITTTVSSLRQQYIIIKWIRSSTTTAEAVALARCKRHTTCIMYAHRNNTHIYSYTHIHIRQSEREKSKHLGTTSYTYTDADTYTPHTTKLQVMHQRKTNNNNCKGTTERIKRNIHSDWMMFLAICIASKLLYFLLSLAIRVSIFTYVHADDESLSQCFVIEIFRVNRKRASEQKQEHVNK